ncbi:MAG: exodeoxyribonuclease V subunit gamma, partial [Clostridiales bacterium]|nr:exodeoxyribonuclease V subunit gamma [Clostridiales bacterium]
FIIGGSGSGKTEYLYRSITREAEAHQLKNYIVIVPEQFTLQTQRKLVQLSSHKAIMNIDVLSFQRLAYRVFDDLGIEMLGILEETGKNLALRKVAAENSSKLTVTRPNLGRMGYISELKSLLSELMQYRVSADYLREFAEDNDLSSILKAKLSDVAVIYDAFTDFISEKYLTTEEILPTLTRLAPQSALLKDAVIAFDEFTGFTPVQYELIARLMTMTDRMLFTVTMDAREDFYNTGGEHELFAMPKETIRLITDAADRCNVQIIKPVVLGNGGTDRFMDAPQLKFLEQNLFRSNSDVYSSKNYDSIEIASCRNPKEELIAAARQIHALVRSEGLRYQEIGVVTGDIKTYGRYVREVFGKYGIPYFLDATKEILFHPFTEFIRAAVELIRYDFSYDSVFRFLRCGFMDLSDNELDQLDNYVLAAGVKGHSRWAKQWLRLPPGMEPEKLMEFDSMRVRIMETVEPFYQDFHKKNATVEQRLLALYNLFAALGVEGKLADKEQECLKSDEPAKAAEYGQVYRIVMDLFDRYAGIMGQEKLDISEFSDILDSGLDAAEVASIPPGYDSVMVGDIERTRQSGIKVLFFIGVNDGIIPSNEVGGGILSQYERQILRTARLPLAPGAREKTFIQRYYLYLNLTRPSKHLIISFSRTDSQGGGLQPSYLIHVLERMFPGLEIKVYGNIYEQPDYTTEAAALDFLIYGKGHKEWPAIVRHFLYEADDIWKSRALRLLGANGVRYEAEPVKQDTAKALYGDKLSGSATRLELFASCAYAHFLSYGLRLGERQVSGFMPLDMGNIYHDALARYSLVLYESRYNWFNVPDTVRDAMANKAFEDTLSGYSNIGAMDTAADIHLTKRMGQIFLETVWALTEQVRRGQFVPSEFEMPFYGYDGGAALGSGGQRADAAGRGFSAQEQAGCFAPNGAPAPRSGYEVKEPPHTRLANYGSLSLRGRIDRIDTYDLNGRKYVK